MGLAGFLESPLLAAAKKLLDRLRQQQEKAKASSVKMGRAAFKANAAQALKARVDASKMDSKVAFADLVQLPRSDSEAGPSVQPASPKDTVVRPSRRHSNPPAGLPPAVSAASLAPGLTSSRRTSKPPAGLPPAVSDASLSDASLTPGLTSSRRTSKPPAGLPPAVSDASLTPGGGFTSGPPRGS